MQLAGQVESKVQKTPRVTFEDNERRQVEDAMVTT